MQNRFSQAVHDQNWELALALLNDGADAQDRLPLGQGHSLLHTALIENRVDIAERALCLGVDPNSLASEDDIHWLAPLHAAVFVDSAKGIDLLLKSGAKVDARDNYGKTPLAIAAELGRTKIAQHLLNHGANPNAVEETGETPLHWAVHNTANSGSARDVISLLIQYGANPGLPNVNGVTAVDVAKKNKDRSTVLLFSRVQSTRGHPEF